MNTRLKKSISNPRKAFRYLTVAAKKRFNKTPRVDHSGCFGTGALIMACAVLLNWFGLWLEINIAQSVALFVFFLGNMIFFLGKPFVLKNLDLFLYLPLLSFHNVN